MALGVVATSRQRMGPLHVGHVMTSILNTWRNNQLQVFFGGGSRSTFSKRRSCLGSRWLEEGGIGTTSGRNEALGARTP